MNKYVIYTSLTGGYDALPQYEVIDSDFDYICFSNDYPDGSKQGIWTIKHIPLNEKDNILSSRYPKLLPHRLLKDYDYSLWLDSNLIISSSKFYDIIRSRIDEGGLWYGIKHPLRDCIYEEAQVCVHGARANFLAARKQVKFLRAQGYPAHNGMFENNLILRKHNETIITYIDDYWWKIFTSYTRRDQLSLFFVFWKYKYSPKLFFLDDTTTRNSGYISYRKHGSKSLYESIKLRSRLWINRILEKLLTFE